MSRDARSRVILGTGIPIAALVFLGLLIFAFSRILLAVPETLAPWIALLFATNILVGCALAAMIPSRRGFTFLISLLVATIVIGGVVGAVVGERPVHSLVEEHEGEVVAAPPEQDQPSLTDEPVATVQPEPAGPPGPAGQPPGGGGGGEASASISAEALAFNTSELSLPAGVPTVIAFDNEDAGQQHNVAIYPPEGNEELFRGEIITGPAKVEYRVPPLDAGEYHFQCDVHPTSMTGTVTVA